MFPLQGERWLMGNVVLTCRNSADNKVMLETTDQLLQSGHCVCVCVCVCVCHAGSNNDKIISGIEQQWSCFLHPVHMDCGGL